MDSELSDYLKDIDCNMRNSNRSETVCDSDAYMWYSPRTTRLRNLLVKIIGKRYKSIVAATGKKMSSDCEIRKLNCSKNSPGARSVPIFTFLKYEAHKS